MSILLSLALAPQFPSPIVVGTPPPGVELLLIDSAPNANTALTLSSIGDMNGDGYADFASGDWGAWVGGQSNVGRCFVVFGAPGLAGRASLRLTDLDGTDGFVIEGDVLDARLSQAMGPAGDVDGDGYDDLLIYSAKVPDALGIRRDGFYLVRGGANVGASGVVSVASLVPPLGARIVPADSNSGPLVRARGVGDVDADGFEDFAVSESQFGAPLTSHPLGNPIDPGLAAGDLDLDGDVDLVVTCGNLQQFRVFWNDGTGQFAEVQHPWTGYPGKLTLADIDLDGGLDLVIQGFTPAGLARLSVVRNQLNGFFGPTTHYPMTEDGMDFDVFDVDADGFLDVAVSVYVKSSNVGSPNRLIVYRNDQAGHLVAGPSLTTPTKPTMVRTGDIDADGDADVGVYCRQNGVLKFYRNDGAGNLSAVPPQGGVSVGLVDNGFELGDLDGDADLDVVLGGVRVLPCTGSITFGTLSNPYVSGPPYRFQLGDFDLDGDLDVLSAGGNLQGGAEFLVSVNAGNGDLSGYRPSASGSTVGYQLACADLDGDGDLDMATIGSGGPNSRQLTLGFNVGNGSFHGPGAGRVHVVRGGATLAAVALLDLGTPTPGSTFTIVGLHSLHSIGGGAAASGDLNGDGIADFSFAARGGVEGPRGSGSRIVLFGAPGLGLASPVDLGALDGTTGFEVRDTADAAGVGGATVGDFDGDGHDDLVVAAADARYPGFVRIGGAYVVFGGPGVGAGGLVSLMAPDGNAIAHFRSTQDADNTPGVQFACADLDGDGRVELVLGASGHDEQLNDRGAVFVVYGAARPLAAGAIPLTQLDGGWGFRLLGERASDTFGARSVAVGDVDGDGLEDVVLGDDEWSLASQSGRAFVLFGQSNGVPEPYCQAKLNSLGCTPAISWAGQLPSVSDPDAFLVTASGVLNQKNGLLFYGLSGRGSATFQGGTLCVRQPVRRTGVQTSGGSTVGDDCSGTFSFDFSAWLDSGIDPNLAAGITVDAQYWSRDPQASFTSSLTGGLEFEIGL